MIQVRSFRFLVALALLFLLQKGCEIRSRLDPAGIEVRLIDGTRLLVTDLRPFSADPDKFQPGDTLIYMNGQFIRSNSSLDTVLRNSQSVAAAGVRARRGAHNIYLIMDLQRLDFRHHPDQATLSESLTYLFAYLSAFLSLGAGVLVFAVRPGRVYARVFLALTIAHAFSIGEIPDGALPGWRMLSEALIVCARTLFPAIYLHLALFFPRPIELPQRRNWLLLIYLWALPSLTLRLYGLLGGWLELRTGQTEVLSLPLEYFYTVLCCVLSGMLIGYSYFRGTGLERRKLRWLLLATCAGVFPGALIRAVLPAFYAPGPEQLSTLYLVVAPLGLLFPPAFAYPLIRHRVVDIQWIFRGALLALGSAWTLRFLLLLPGAFIVRSMLLTERMEGWHAILLLSLLLGMSRIQGLAPETLDRWLFPTLFKKREKVLRVNRRLDTTTHPETLWPTLGRGLADILQGTRTYTFLWHHALQSFELWYQDGEKIVPSQAEPASESIPEASSLVALLKKSNHPLFLWYELPNDIGNLLPSAERNLLLRRGLALVVPMRSDTCWVGLLAFGEKQNQEEYTTPEIEFLVLLAHTAAATYLRLTAEGRGSADSEEPLK